MLVYIPQCKWTWRYRQMLFIIEAKMSFHLRIFDPNSTSAGNWNGNSTHDAPYSNYCRSDIVSRVAQHLHARWSSIIVVACASRWIKTGTGMPVVRDGNHFHARPKIFVLGDSDTYMSYSPGGVPVRVRTHVDIEFALRFHQNVVNLAVCRTSI